MPQRPTGFRPETRERLHRGARALADACRATLGPRAHPVLIQRRGRPLVSDDGSVIREAFDVDDPVEKLGAEVLRDAANRTEAMAGDGATTSLVMGAALYSGGIRHLAAGAAVPDLTRGMERGLRRAVSTLDGMSLPAATRDIRRRVATVAAGNDAALGTLVADAFERVGPQGVVWVEPGAGPEAGLESVEGTRFEAGHLSPFFVTDREREVADHSDPLVLLCSGRVESVTPLLPLLERVAGEGRPLFLVAGDVADEVVANLIVHELRGTLRSLVVKAPGPSGDRRGLLEDLGALTGARIVEGSLNAGEEGPRFADLGGASRVMATHERTTVMGGPGSPEEVEIRCKELRREIDFSASPLKRERLEGRLARLSGGIAVLRVGGRHETEAEARLRGARRAVDATAAAQREGVVPGGGLAFLRARDAVTEEAARSSGDEAKGAHLLRAALELPARQIAENAGMDADAQLERMRTSGERIGLEAGGGELTDLIEAGIVDPLPVVRTALENSVSVAAMLLRTDTALTSRADPEGNRVTEPPQARRASRRHHRIPG